MKKKWLVLLMSGSIMMMGTTVWAESKIQTIQVLMETINVAINGQKSELTKDAILYNGSVYVPLRSMSELLGAEVSWSNDTRTVNLDFIADRAKQIAASSQYGIYQYVAIQNNSILTDLLQALKTNNGSGMVNARERYEELHSIAVDMKDDEMKQTLEKLGAAVELLRGGWESKNLDDYGIAWSIFSSNADNLNKQLKVRLNSGPIAAK